MSRSYHVEMMLGTLRKLKYPNNGDTRNYVDLDEGESKLLIELLERDRAIYQKNNFGRLD